MKLIDQYSQAPDQFTMLPVFQAQVLFTSASHLAVGFLRRMYNLANILKDRPADPATANSIPVLAGLPPLSKTPTSERGPETPDNQSSRKSKRLQNSEPSAEGPSPADVAALKASYPSIQTTKVSNCGSLSRTPK